MSTLVIVESPTKARTIRNYLPNSYQVEASMGHVRDLPSKADEIPAAYKEKPWKNLAVDVENDFKPIYVIPKTKKKGSSRAQRCSKEGRRANSGNR